MINPLTDKKFALFRTLRYEHYLKSAKYWLTLVIPSVTQPWFLILIHLSTHPASLQVAPVLSTGRATRREGGTHFPRPLSLSL